jgi:hypothetical protein
VVRRIARAGRRENRAYVSCYVEFSVRDSGLRRAMRSFSTRKVRRKKSRDAQRWNTFALHTTTKYGDEDFFLT